MKRTPIAFVVVAVALCAVAVPGASLAAPPSNDDFANATIVGAADLPYTATVVNTEATTEANEPLQCVAPPTGQDRLVLVHALGRHGPPGRYVR